MEFSLTELHAVHSHEGNVLFNDALNTFYLRLYGVYIAGSSVPKLMATFLLQRIIFNSCIYLFFIFVSVIMICLVLYLKKFHIIKNVSIVLPCLIK